MSALSIFILSFQLYFSLFSLHLSYLLLFLYCQSANSEKGVLLPPSGMKCKLVKSMDPTGSNTVMETQKLKLLWRRSSLLHFQPPANGNLPNEVTVCKSTPQSPDLNLLEHLSDIMSSLLICINKYHAKYTQIGVLLVLFLCLMIIVLPS